MGIWQSFRLAFSTLQYTVMAQTLIRGVTVVSAQGQEKRDLLLPGESDRTIDGDGLLALPGLIDCHVHFRDPGFPHKATMQSEAIAARAGGVTTVCEMPNTNPPTVTVAALADKVRRSGDIRECDIRFFFGVTEAAHLAALRDLLTGDAAELQRLRKRCCGVKLYLDHSTGNQKVDAALVPDVFALCAQTRTTVVCHCEDPEINAKAAASVTRTDVAAHPLRRPPEAEVASILSAVEIARQTHAHLHVAHLSTAGGLDIVRAAKAEGLHVTCEVAPQHLFLTVEDFETLGTLCKMNPPLRTREHRDALWAGIADGTVDCVSTDHAPHTLEEKANPEPLAAPSGMPGVETMVPLLLTAASGRWPHPTAAVPPTFRLTYSDIVRLCYENPNRIFHLGKSDPTAGGEGTLLLVDPNRQWTLERSMIKAHCGWSPFEHWTLRGAIADILTI